MVRIEGGLGNGKYGSEVFYGFLILGAFPAPEDSYSGSRLDIKSFGGEYKRRP